LTPKLISLETKLDEVTKNLEQTQLYLKIVGGISAVVIGYFIYRQIVPNRRELGGGVDNEHR